MEERRNFRRAVGMGLTAVIMAGTLMVWGVPFLVKTAVFLGDLNSSRRPVDKNDLIPPPPPSLSTEFEATNSSTMVVRGWGEAGATVYLTRNATTVGNLVVAEDGGFLFGNVSLEVGRNDFVAVAMDRAGNKSFESKEVSVELLVGTPRLEIASPHDQQTVTGKEKWLEVKGQTDVGARVTVNERVVVVGSDGLFVAKHGLAAGENTIVVVASDRAGNQARKELVVVYTP